MPPAASHHPAPSPGQPPLRRPALVVAVVGATGAVGVEMARCLEQRNFPVSELRLLASARFDSQSLLCVVLSGDARLLDKLRREELIPLGSRIRTRLATGVATREELLACLEHLLTTAGNASLMTKQLRNTLCDHAAGNYRIFIGMAAELLMTAAQREITELDEKLYLQVFAQPETQAPRRVGAR